MVFLKQNLYHKKYELHSSLKKLSHLVQLIGDANWPLGWSKLSHTRCSVRRPAYSKRISFRSQSVCTAPELSREPHFHPPQVVWHHVCNTNWLD